MAEPNPPSDITAAEQDGRQIGEVVDRLCQRYGDTPSLHRDVIEAAVRSGWANYDTAKATSYRAILAERAAVDALQPWFGPPDRPSSATNTVHDTDPR